MVRHRLLAAALCCGLACPAGADAPGRVVSMNLCTDQLAMMLAGPGQLVSVSYLARDVRASAMAAEAAALPVNHGMAEEIFLLRPDLVLAGRYTTRATVDVLQRLAIPVEIFDPEEDFDGIRANLRKMGVALGHETAAEAAVARFDADLAMLRDGAAYRPRAALYSANGYTSGDQSLSGQILHAAGFDNIATEAGIPMGGTLALEQLALSDPDLVVLGRRYPGASRAEELLDHPVVAVLRDRVATGALTDRDWVCGTPHVLRAVAALTATRHALEAMR